MFFNVAVVVRAVGAAWEALDPRPARGRGGARGHARRRCFRTVTLPALRPAIVSAASVVFLFCATAFGVVLTLGGLRYATVETEIYLLTTQLLDLQAAAALSVLQLLVVTALLVVAGRLARRARPDRRRGVGPTPPTGPPGPAGRSRSPRSLLALVAAPIAHPGGRVAAGRRRVEPGRTTAR